MGETLSISMLKMRAHTRGSVFASQVEGHTVYKQRKHNCKKLLSIYKQNIITETQRKWFKRIQRMYKESPKKEGNYKHAHTNEREVMDT
jgi:isocitrate/isopropylmalate dehydrogenase